MTAVVPSLNLNIVSDGSTGGTGGVGAVRVSALMIPSSPSACF